MLEYLEGAERVLLVVFNAKTKKPITHDEHTTNKNLRRALCFINHFCTSGLACAATQRGDTPAPGVPSKAIPLFHLNYFL